MLATSPWSRCRLAVVLGSILVAALPARAAEFPKKPAISPETAAQGLLERILPQHAGRFTLQAIPKDNGHDVFELESAGGKVVIRGSSGLAIASGLNAYLKDYCHCHVSWSGDQLKLPEPLPTVGPKIHKVCPYQYRYCFNYCTFSYTMAFWDWPQWERIIDWMALHGINMPLAVTGQESVWQAVYRQLGLTDQQIGEFLVGPAYLPFGWMGCMDGWGGPLPQSWIDRRRQLEEKILQRERELGMTPVLQGFTGHVPAALKDRFPKAKFQRVSDWCGFPGTWFVDPLDPLFHRIGKLFVEEQTRQFGTDHLYASDTFIEMSPPSKDPAFLSGMGRAVYEAMQAADSEAVWVMQGWIFVNNPKFWQPPQGRALLSAVPNDRMLLLDLFGEANPAWSKTEAFYGKPWAWCIIQNFGGRVGLWGGLPEIARNLNQALTSPQRGRLAGLGLIMEGLGANAVVYDFVTDMTWRTEVPQVDAWLREFVHRRYGRRHGQAEEAWKLLLESAYQTPGYAGSAICRRPVAGAAGGWGYPVPPYDPAKVVQAWQKLLACADDLQDVDTYRFDLVLLTREVLSNQAGPLYAEIGEAYQARDRKALGEASQRLFSLIREMDELLATRKEFLLGKWLSDAKAWATNAEEARLYEWNARNLLTLWGPRDSVLHEYAQREWSGLLGGFYLPRWEQFVRRLDASLTAGTPFDAAAFEREIRHWDEQWTHQTESYPAAPRGDSIALARALWPKYGPHALEPECKSLTTGKPTKCSHALAPYPAYLANDGQFHNTSRYWATDVNVDKDAWWQVDLEQACTVGRVVVVLYYGDQRHYGFTVETSLDGQTWDLVADHRDKRVLSVPQGITCRFAPRAVRYLRVTVTDNSANTGRHLVEVMAFEK